MPKNHLPISLLSLEPAIDRRPLMVTADISVADGIDMMGKAQSSCNLPNLGLPLNTALMNEARATGILVMDGPRLMGLFTQREALQAIASGRNLAQTRLVDLIRKPEVVLTQIEDTESNVQDVFAALALLRQHQIHHVPVLDEQGHVLGMATPASLRQVLQVDELLKARQLSEVMLAPVVQVSGQTAVLDLARLMAEAQVDCAVVTEPGTHNQIRTVGIVTAMDLIQLQALQQDLALVPVTQSMNPKVLQFSPAESVLVAYIEMQQQQTLYALVIPESGESLGVITLNSFLQTLELAEMASAVEQVQRSIDEFAAEQAQRSLHREIGLRAQAQDSPEELREKLECHRLLTAMALRIRESLNLDMILHTAVEEVRQFLQTDRVLIYHFNPDLSGTVLVESFTDHLQPALGSTIKDTYFGKHYSHSYREGRIQITDNIYAAGLTQCHIDILTLFDVRANLVVPIIQGDHLWGLLCAFHCSGPRHWRQLEVDLLQQLATHMAIAIQQSELYQQVQNELAERKRAEEQIQASLREKESLLKEIHHRVKNNLQIISSLLRLQSDYIHDKQALALFKDSQHRIESMALIHEKLYQSKDLSRIDFAEYIRDLAASILRSYTAGSQAVSLKTNAENIWLNIDTAIPCGLIINELVSNALKHAFPANNYEQEITVNIISENDKFLLTISDNGIGFPQDLDFRNTDSLGLQLVCTFTEQLEGNIELDSQQGTNFKIVFAELRSDRRNQKHV